MGNAASPGVGRRVVGYDRLPGGDHPAEQCIKIVKLQSGLNIFIIKFLRFFVPRDVGDRQRFKIFLIFLIHQNMADESIFAFRKSEKIGQQILKQDPDIHLADVVRLNGADGVD